MKTQRRFGAFVSPDGIRFAVWSGAASRLWVSLFDREGDSETARLEMQAAGEGVHSLFVPGLTAGARYGFRADGEYAPERGLWFDPDKLLVDPYAVEIDRPYAYDCATGCAPRRGRRHGVAVPKAIASALPSRCRLEPPIFRPGGLIYEVPSAPSPSCTPKCRNCSAARSGRWPIPAIIEHLHKPRRRRRRADAGDGFDRRAASAAARSSQRLGLQSGDLHGARSAPCAGRPGGASRTRSRRCAKPALASSSISSSTTPARATSSGRRCRCAASTTAPTTGTRRRHPDRLVNDTGTGNTLACSIRSRRSWSSIACATSSAMPASMVSASIWRPILGRGRQRLRCRMRRS